MLKEWGEVNEERKLTILALLCCIIMGVCAIPTKPVQAHRIWKKYTKVASGTYNLDYEYYSEKQGLQEYVTLKLGNVLSLVEL